MTGALEEAAKATGGFIETMRAQPLVLMMGLMNIVLLVFLFYYLSRITARTEFTVKQLFEANDSLYKQWGTVIKDQVTLTEKTMHCILPEDAIKLLNLRPPAPAVPMPPARPQKDINVDPPKPGRDASIDPETGLIIPFEPSVEDPAKPPDQLRGDPASDGRPPQ